MYYPSRLVATKAVYILLPTLDISKYSKLFYKTEPGHLKQM